MKNNLLDKYFKDKLSNIDGGNPLDTWDALSNKMDTQIPQDPIEDYTFDQKIKDAITDITVIEMPAWQSFVPSLDLEENLQELEADIALDDTVKNSLEHLDSQYDASTWDMLADKLDAVDNAVTEGQDVLLDSVSYDRLLNYTVPQRAGDWEVFNKELDKEFVLPYKLLFKYKLAEIAILASLILIFFQAQPHIKNHFEHNQIADTSSIKQSNELQTQSELSTTIKRLENIETTNSSNHITSTFDKKVSAKHIVNNASATNISKGNISSNTISTKIADQNTNTNSARPSTALHTPSIVDTYTNSDDTSLKASTTVTAIVESTNEQVPVKEMPPQLVIQEEGTDLEKYGDLLNIKKLPMEVLMNIPFTGDDVTACFACDTDNTILRWRLGAHLDAIYTYIMTPYDNILNLNSYNHATLGYGAGLSTSLLYGKWELASGFKFTSRQYTPKGIENVGNVRQGYLSIEIDKIQMNLLSVPLNLRYHFNDKKGKTHFYMHGGATMHVATQANYFIKSNFLGNNKRPGLDESKILFEEAEILSDKIFSLGWFEGGSYIENRYLTVNLGLGFERKISSRYSIFGQTTYAQFLDSKGLGPNNDRFNSVF